MYIEISSLDEQTKLNRKSILIASTAKYYLLDVQIDLLLFRF